MASRYLAELVTADVRAAQARSYGRSATIPAVTSPDAIGPDERAFIEARDSCYLATVSSDGWPYLQHRGGPAGFLRVLDEHTVAFADLKGNRQLLSVGNLAGNDRVSLFLIDYPHRARLKLLGHARVVEARDQPALVDRVAPAELRARTERVIEIDVVGLNWNCSAYITPRYTEAQLRQALAAGWRPEPDA